jgi:hypothetical protein
MKWRSHRLLPVQILILAEGATASGGLSVADAKKRAQHIKALYPPRCREKVRRHIILRPPDYREVNNS